jgi:hypothetical protein
VQPAAACCCCSCCGEEEEEASEGGEQPRLWCGTLLRLILKVVASYLALNLPLELYFHFLGPVQGAAFRTSNLWQSDGHFELTAWLVSITSVIYVFHSYSFCGFGMIWNGWVSCLEACGCEQLRESYVQYGGTALVYLYISMPIFISVVAPTVESACASHCSRTMPVARQALPLARQSQQWYHSSLHIPQCSQRSGSRDRRGLVCT